MTCLRTLLAGLVLLASAAVALAVTPLVDAGRSASAPAAAQARRVAIEFFDSINERRYERTCALLSARYYAENRIPSRHLCVVGLRIGLIWSQEVRFRVIRVHVAGGLAVVDALADGVPGEVALVRERGEFRVLRIKGR